jgi:hypothetical protein
MKYTNNHDIPVEVIRAVESDPYHKGDGVVLSVTQLIKPPRISGQTDTLSLEEKMLTDYKCTSVYAIGTDKPEWEEQLNLYAWLWRKHGHEIERLRILTILRDWRRSEADKKFDYPQAPVVSIDIPLWGFVRQSDFVAQRVELHQEAMANPDGDLPECSDEDRWLRRGKNIRCEGNWCQVAPFCSQWQSIKEQRQ